MSQEYQTAVEEENPPRGRDDVLISGEPCFEARGSPVRRPPHLATTHAASGTEMPHESENEQWRRVRLERIQPTQVQNRLDRLERQLLALSQMSLNPAGQGIQSTSQSFVDSSLTRLAQKRLRFDVKDVHQSIDRWDHFFLLYGVTSDREKFFAVEQLLPPHIEQAYASDDRWEPSYEWLVSFLKQKFEPRFACYEIMNRTITSKTLITEARQIATQAASCPKDHIIKHFMLDMCSQSQKQKMKPFLLLPANEFDLKLKMIIQEDNSRYGGERGGFRKINQVLEEDRGFDSPPQSSQQDRSAQVVNRAYSASNGGNNGRSVFSQQGGKHDF